MPSLALSENRRTEMRHFSHFLLAECHRNDIVPPSPPDKGEFQEKENAQN
jgi:hypothetical protein